APSPVPAPSPRPSARLRASASILHPFPARPADRPRTFEPCSKLDVEVNEDSCPRPRTFTSSSNSMDLLKGYGSDDSSAASSSSSASHHGDNTSSAPVVEAPEATPAATAEAAKGRPKPQRTKTGGRRILSLGAVLPPEILDRLTRPPGEDDSSTSSFEGDARGNGSGAKPMKRKRTSNDDNHQPESSKGSSGNREDLNSLLNDLRSAPLHVSKKKTSKNGTSQTTKDVSGASTAKEDGKLGMAFMSYTSSTTTSKKSHEVVDVHASKKSVSQAGRSSTSGPTPPTTSSVPSFSRMSAAAPVVPSYSRSAPQYPHASSMPEYPVDTQAEMEEESSLNTAPVSVDAASYNNYGSMSNKSRRQRREEERALRSGKAFREDSSAASATEIHQPSPTEYAPTAHAAAIASRAARLRGASGGGGGGVKNIAMYDPQSGTDVKGLGVSGKHRSKHQINQLMASAMSLEAHRASEAELARFGMGGGTGGKGSRADAKRKYGW
ncbi:hypothetical protein ACHAWF_016804, partial [Thalassiosira exigua]